MVEIGVYPPAVEFNSVLQKARFFMGDRWIDIGDFTMKPVPTPTHEVAMVVSMPNVNEFFEGRKELDDGTKDWCLWGPRVN